MINSSPTNGSPARRSAESTTIKTPFKEFEKNKLIELKNENIEILKERLLILTPNFEKMEKYAALKKAYDNYKLLEAMLGDENGNK